MRRVALLICAAVIVAGCGATTHSARSYKSPWVRRTYSVGQIKRAFAAQGVHLRVRAASDRPAWVRLGATVPLELIVFRSIREAGLAVVQTITAAHPGRPPDTPDAIPLRLGPSHGWANDIQGAEFMNVRFAYYDQYPGLDRRVRAALRRLQVPADFLS